MLGPVLLYFRPLVSTPVYQRLWHILPYTFLVTQILHIEDTTESINVELVGSVRITY